MKRETENISIERIRQAAPSVKGIDNDILIDNTEFTVSENNGYIYKYPLRLDGVLISIREKGSSKFNVNLKEFITNPNDLILCTPGDLVQATPIEGVHKAQTIMVSANFLKETYISLNSFAPFFAARKDKPVFHLTEEEVKEMSTYFNLIEEAITSEDYFRNEIVKRLLASYLYKIGSILYRHHPNLQEDAAKPLKREEVLFKQFIEVLGKYHHKERRVDFYADQLYLSPKHFSTVIKKVSGRTAGEWIDEYVILEIKTLLRYSTMSIQEVAYYMNFPNPSFFGKYFKHHTGMSPSEYKAQL